MADQSTDVNKVLEGSYTSNKKTITDFLLIIALRNVWYRKIDKPIQKKEGK